MRLETQEAVGSIYSRVLKQQQSATEARNKATNEQRRLMLAGKVKAYTDVLGLLKGRYGRKMLIAAERERSAMSDKCRHGIRDTVTNLPYCRRCDNEAKSSFAAPALLACPDGCEREPKYEADENGNWWIECWVCGRAGEKSKSDTEAVMKWNEMAKAERP